MWYCISSDKNNKDFEKTFKVLSRKGAKRMKRFNLGDYDYSYVMNCETEEEAKIFTKFLHEQGLSWDSERCYLTDNNWNWKKKNTCYNFKEGTYCDVDFYKRYEYNVLKFSDFDWSEEKTKVDTERILKNFEEVKKILKGDKKMVGIGGEFRKVEFLSNDKVFSGKYEVTEIEIPRILYDEFKEHTCTFKNCRTNVDDYSIREIFLLISEEVQYFKELISKFNEKYEKKETLEELKEEYRKMASEHKFEKGVRNYEILHNLKTDIYFLDDSYSYEKVINTHFTTDIDFAKSFLERMNKALERWRKEVKND